MLIEFNDELTSLTDDEKLKILLAYHRLPLDYKIDSEDISMVIMALNQDDLESVTIDNEGGMNIAYYGDDWQKPITNKEQNEQESIRLN
jgi:hypothetical protein